MNSRGISTVSVRAADPQKLRRSATHSSLPTSASASEKVGWDFSYHAVLRTLAAPSPLATYRWARRVTTEKSANIAGAVRPIALSDQCFWVSNPSCWRASQKVASICHLFTKWVIIRSGAASRSVHRRAWVSKWPSGSRIRTQRSGTAGSPELYQRAGLVTISTTRSALPYHWGSVTLLHPVAGSAATGCRGWANVRLLAGYGPSGGVCVAALARKERRRA